MIHFRQPSLTINKLLITWSIVYVILGNLSPSVEAKSYLARHENGVTIQLINGSKSDVGTTREFEGKHYLIVDNTTIHLTSWRTLNPQPADYTSIVTTLVDDMSFLFHFVPTFNQDISSWDVSNVTTMSNMFSNSAAFNQDISAWDVSNVTNMNSMFAFAKAFNQDISNWNVSNVTNMNRMFNYTEQFNQNISKWNVSKVTNMNRMFYGAKQFNQNISVWKTTHLKKICKIVQYAPSFSYSLTSWNTQNIEDVNIKPYKKHLNSNKCRWGY